MNSAVFAEELKITVKGMVCSFCAQGIKKKFSKESAVSDIKISLETGEVRIVLKNGMVLSDDVIRSILKESGYTVGKIERI